MLARGEGKPWALNWIENKNFFNWGFKSMHATQQQYKKRNSDSNFLPRGSLLPRKKSSNVQLSKLIKQVEYSLKYFRYILKNSKQDEEAFINYIKHEMDRCYDDNHLFTIKEWLCSFLHACGNPLFADVTPWISTQSGETRYDRALHFGVGYNPKKSLPEINSRFVIFDYWVLRSENEEVFYFADYVFNKLNEYGIRWFNSEKDKEYHNDEVMIKHASFPQRLIGYYYSENGNLQYYFINPHYLEKWKNSNNFKIGHDICFFQDEDEIDYKNGFPFNVMYGFDPGKVGFNKFNGKIQKELNRY